ncbi:MAG TPA: dCTP deaminase [Candidatus Thermoplasmatota archaeon]|nr:dCTP deaminase [Candidatus Thermoplasmatota archaeon]
MAVWSDTDFLAARAAGAFAAEPWLEQDLTPNGLDLRIGHVLVPSLMKEAQMEGVVSVPGMTRFLVGTQTVLTMPSDAVGSLWIRSSFARKGILASFGKVDAGFRGNLTLGAFNASHEPVDIRVGDTFCQVVLHRMASPPRKPYAGKYQDQRGITKAKA